MLYPVQVSGLLRPFLEEGKKFPFLPGRATATPMGLLGSAQKQHKSEQTLFNYKNSVVSK